MSTIRRRVNRVLGDTLGLQVMPATVRRVALDSRWFSRMVHFNRLIERIEPIPGDIVECGVAAGTSLALLASLAKAHGQQRDIWGFDSWAGLPSPDERDLGEASVAAPGIFSEASTEKVLEELLAYGLQQSEIDLRVKLQPGLFGDTLAGYRGEIALLHIDVDLYESYRDCLHTLWPRVARGGVIAFDEYDESEAWPGARRAVDEFLGGQGVDLAALARDEVSGKWWIAKP